MTITLDGTTGITTPDIAETDGLTVDGQAIIGAGVAGSSNLTNLTSGTPPQLVAGWSVPAITWSPSSSTEAVFARNGSMQVDILAGANSFSNLNFSDPDDEDVGQLSYDHSTDAMRFRTNNTERMRIDSSGNLLVGTTSGSDKVTVNGTVNATAFVGDGSALTGFGGSTTAGDVGTYAYLINTVGNIGITPGATTAGSSLRYSAQSTNSNTSSSGYSLGHTYSSGPSGTWRAMGGRTTTTSYTYAATLYVRIS